jgi:hypothetical protein
VVVVAVHRLTRVVADGRTPFIPTTEASEDPSDKKYSSP